MLLGSPLATSRPPLRRRGGVEPALDQERREVGFHQRIGVGRQLRQGQRRADTGIVLAVGRHEAGINCGHVLQPQVVHRGRGIVRAVDGVVHDACVVRVRQDEGQRRGQGRRVALVELLDVFGQLAVAAGDVEIDEERVHRQQVVDLQVDRLLALQLELIRHRALGQAVDGLGEHLLEVRIGGVARLVGRAGSEDPAEGAGDILDLHRFLFRHRHDAVEHDPLEDAGVAAQNELAQLGAVGLAIVEDLVVAQGLANAVNVVGVLVGVVGRQVDALSLERLGAFHERIPGCLAALLQRHPLCRRLERQGVVRRAVKRRFGQCRAALAEEDEVAVFQDGTVGCEEPGALRRLARPAGHRRRGRRCPARAARQGSCRRI